MRELRGVCGGRYRTRTDDLFRVKEARYQLRQSPMTRRVAIDITRPKVVPLTTRMDTREIRHRFGRAPIFG